MIRLSAAGTRQLGAARALADRAQTEVIVDVSTGAPTIIHWGSPLGDDADLETVLPALSRPLVYGTFDTIAPISIVPEHGSGFTGRPGLLGRRRQPASE